LGDEVYPTVPEEAAELLSTLGGVGEKSAFEVEDDTDHLFGRREVDRSRGERLAVDRRHIKRFLRRTGMTAATGFAADLDWLRSTVFELLVLSTILERRMTLRSARRLQQALKREVPSLRRELAFRMVIREP
jgi:hypothetical protein